MNKKIIFLLLLLFLLFFFGCTNKNEALNKAYSFPETEEFISKFPDASIQVSHISKTASESILKKLSKRCGEKIEAQEFWYVRFEKGDSALAIWLNSSLEMVCLIKEGSWIPKTEPEDGAKNGDTRKCFSNLECNDKDPCTVDICSGSPGTCSHKKITECKDNDSCCPEGCTNENDNNCKKTSQNECENDRDCNDNNPCTLDQCLGTPKKCSYYTITSCISGDGCCPSNCTPSRDSDCS